VVCTYMLLLSVKDEITSKEWNTICLDEAHIIKNRGAKTSAVAMKLKSKNRIMLTGTPVQNHLGELWNLFQFVNPGLLGSFEDFNRRFIVPIEQNSNRIAQQQLDRLVKPFMLRRTKDKVARELPEKEEIYQHVTMSEEEQLTYEAMRQKAEATLIANGLGRVSMNTLAEITRLRLTACCQSKITALLELLQTVTDGYEQQEEESRGGALVFSQFTTYLAEIRRTLDDAHVPYLYIDGTVPIIERQKLVEKFQAGECPVFLISLKAGGLGLNLTRANYVIHMDPWWNPAIESQATDRSHRIGQKKAVTVYHLISQGTIEEKIQRLHERKQNLVSNILAATDMSHKLTGEELLEMVRG
ncbi:MAG: DEAD/DEAH box helicase, partial [Prevotella sp.]|nr:DEAD/DEAH box helicase [Prevotella sp.]